MIHQKIEKLIPFISEEFITYPLWKEGKYIPFLKFVVNKPQLLITRALFNVAETFLSIRHAERKHQDVSGKQVSASID